MCLFGKNTLLSTPLTTDTQTMLAKVLGRRDQAETFCCVFRFLFPPCVPFSTYRYSFRTVLNNYVSRQQKMFYCVSLNKCMFAHLCMLTKPGTVGYAARTEGEGAVCKSDCNFMEDRIFKNKILQKQNFLICRKVLPPNYMDPRSVVAAVY